jgi:hypothetical protein
VIDSEKHPKICHHLALWVCLMSRFSNAELKKFRDTSRCSACVHYSGCALWLALLLMNDELSAPGLDLVIPDITKACLMFSPARLSQSRDARLTCLGLSTNSLRRRRRILCGLVLSFKPDRGHGFVATYG